VGSKEKKHPIKICFYYEKLMSFFDSISDKSPNKDFLEDFFKEEILEEDHETKSKISKEFIEKNSTNFPEIQEIGKTN
jgi:hypothetical protein